MRDEKEERKKQARSNKQTRQSNTAHLRQSLYPEKMSCLRWEQTNKAKQHSTPKAVTLPRKNELPQVGLEPTTLYTLDRALYQLSYRGSSAGWTQISICTCTWNSSPNEICHGHNSICGIQYYIYTHKNPYLAKQQNNYEQ